MKEIKNKIPGSMSFAEGFLGPKRIDKNHHYSDYIGLKKYLKSLDYDKIDYIKIGLAEDMDCTGDYLYEDNEFNLNCYFYDHSCWALPCIVIFYYNDAPTTVYFDTNIYQRGENLKKMIEELKEDLENE